MGRPKKDINWDIVQKQVEAGCKAKEIYGDLCDADTFYNRFKEHFGKCFSDYSDDLYSVGDGRIKFTQYMKALAGNIQMLCRLGDVRLGQNKTEEKVSPFQNLADVEHENMILRSRVAKLEEKVNGYEPKAG